MKRFRTALLVAALAFVALYTSRDLIPAALLAPSGLGWRIPAQAEIDRLKQEEGMRLSAAEVKKLKSAVVKRVVDGDTVELAIGGATVKVRLLNLDTPETVDPRRTVEEYGKEASNFTKSILQPGTKVFYRYDVEKEDKYGRQLLHLYLEDGTWFNALLVRAGYAQVATYPPNVSAAAFFKELERRARQESIGLWQIPRK